ncbi:MAG TPA: hypothetical protein VJ254_23820, partial [Streptosporangiaceae bacterium]|nr:hypothetical protein [Streptosporangiaceae bacterium]
MYLFERNEYFPQQGTWRKPAPVIQAGRTADRSAVLSSVQNVNYPLAAADFGAVLCHITRRRGCRRAAGLPRLRERPARFPRRGSSAQADEWNDDDSLG